MRPSSCAGLLAVLLAACHAVGPGLPPDAVRGLPWGEQPADQMAWTARQAVERGMPERALVELETILRLEPQHVDAHRLRQDLMRTRGRRGRLLDEARRRVAKRPEDGHAHYLLARISDDPQQKLAGFRRAAELAPESVWPWLGLAHTLRATDRSRALQIYERLFAASGQHPLVGVAFAAALREDERYEAAALVYQALRSDRRVPGVGDLGLAQVAIERERRDAAWGALMEALRHRPFDPGVQGLVHGWTETNATRDQRRQVADVLREHGDRLRAFGDQAGAQVLADLLEDNGQVLAARRVLERRLAERPSPALQRAHRRLVLAMGDVEAFLQRLRSDVPRHVVAAEDSELRSRWLTLLDGPWMDGAPLVDAAGTLALLAALRDVGMLVEVERLAEVAMQRFPEAEADWLQRQDEARRELAFEAGLRRLLYRGYRAGDAADLATVVERIRELSLRVLGEDVVGEPQSFAVPLVGEMLDPFSGGGLCEHLARYNRHLVLGRRAGGTAEGLLVTRLSLRELPDTERQRLPGRCFEVVGTDRDIRALGGVLGSDLAGVALLNHFLVDHDAVVDWALGLLDRRRIARRDQLQLTRDPIPGDVGLDPLDVSWRLALRSPVADEDLAEAVLGMIRDHERRHLVDSFHYMPIEWNLLRGAGLLLRFGLSPAQIEAEMERRAELAALALSPHTELVLAHIVDFYGDPPLHSPHHIGFSRLHQQLHAELLELGVAPAQAAPSRWHELDMALVREAASRLLDRLPGGR
jgi:tetratricopeptide (TPR) repeat protein